MLLVKELNDVFCDALSWDDEYLVFGSFWGRDTAIQELLARITLARSEGGLSQLSFDGYLPSERCKVERLKFLNPEQLNKLTGRVPKANLFGNLVHLWIFDEKVRTPDYVNRQAYLLIRPGQVDQIKDVWELVKDVCHLPLLEHWQEAIFSLLRNQGWLKMFEGYQMNLICIDIPEELFDIEISQMVTTGQLTAEQGE